MPTFDQSTPAEAQKVLRKEEKPRQRPNVAPLVMTSVPPAAREQAQLRKMFADSPSANNAQYKPIRTENTPPPHLETDE